MCGFALSCCLNGKDGSCKNHRLRAKIEHRGPDETVAFSSSFCDLLFYRLAIKDLQHGSQPWVNGEHNFRSAVNGELYNEETIRELMRKNFPADRLPSGDMQLLAHYIFRFGLEGLPALDGMFAGFVIDLSDSKIYFFRDRVGEKPLFFMLDDDHFILASEARVLAPENSSTDYSGDMPEEVALGRWCSESQFGSRMRQLKNGSCGIFDLQTRHLQINRYWDWPKRQLRSTSTLFDQNAYIHQIEPLIEAAVVSRLASDVPVSVLLSGGIDSALVARYAVKHLGKLKAYTLDFHDSKYSESELARNTAQHLKLDHQIVSVSYEELATSVPQVLQGMDIPILDSGCLSLFAISRVVSEDFKVALTGDGGDELFMGYQLFRDLKYLVKLRKIGWPVRKGVGLFSPIVSRWERDNYLSFSTKYARLEDVLKFPNIRAMDIALSPFAGTEIFSILAGRISNAVKVESDSISALETVYREQILPCLYLTKADRMSMINGLELRAPLLSPELIKLATEIPQNEITSRESKFPLRILADLYLPTEVSKAKKHGFSAPFNEIKKYLNEPKWTLEKIGIQKVAASRVWNQNSENAGIASWSLLVMDHFMKRA
jgi:asparagine synthase (glutamine-hydrolysing)